MSLSGTIAGYKSVNEFLGDLVEAVKDTPWPAAVAKALPWAGIIGEAAADSVAPIKFVLKLYEKATQINDVTELAELACTVAFQRSVQQSLTSSMWMPKQSPGRVAASVVKEMQTGASKAFDFQTMRLSDATQHEFYRDARAKFQRFLELTCVDETARNQLLADVDRRFAANLELLVTNRDTMGKFEPFYRWLLLEKSEQRAYQALRRHAAYQRWLYEERRILRDEPFALQHTYVRTDCGVLRWGDLEQRHKDRTAKKTEQPDINPFLDHPEIPDHGGRHDVVEAVLKQLANPNFRDLIVIQGPAGTGKSSFTLRLCVELLDRGLMPVRIELKHLDTSANRHIRDTLPEAVRLADSDFDPAADCFTYDDGLFLDNKIFSETATLEGTEISRYVLILDAWDEISIGAEEGFQQHVERLLKEIRDTYLSDHWRHPVRVILTGRPTEAVTQGRLLRDDARLLTLRYFTPLQLDAFHKRLGEAVKRRPIASPNWTPWSVPKDESLAAVRAKYREGFEAQAKAIAEGRGRHAADGDLGLDLLGSPLLGLLSLRLLAHWPGDPTSLFDSRTVLYRNLVDLLLGGGRAPEAPDPPVPHLSGDELRRLLWGTAEAMTVLGREGLPKAELLARVEISGEFDRTVLRLVDDVKMSRLLVSFFFHGGRTEQGCEFSHKSFREYLFAESVVEVLKSIGRTLKEAPSERDVQRGYWRDFSEDDPRRAFSHRLAEMLGPQWLTVEIQRHLKALLEWEVQRAAGCDPYPVIPFARPTSCLSLEQWAIVRDALADLWDWWGEGVHLRPQPSRSRNQDLVWDEPVALELAKRDRLLSSKDIPEIRPPRMTTFDSHLGDGLFQLCCDLHRALCDFPKEPLDTSKPRRYQSCDGKGRVRFAPGGKNGGYWSNYHHRMEAAGYRWRFHGLSASCVDLRLIDLSGANLRGAVLSGAVLSRADLSGANLSGANLSGTGLIGTDLSDADLSGASLGGAFLIRAFLGRANLSGTDLSGAYLGWADLSEALLDPDAIKLAQQHGAILDEKQIEEAKPGHS